MKLCTLDTFYDCTQFQTFKRKELIIVLRLIFIPGKLQFVRYFLLKKTFQPTKRFYSTWECFRCAISFFQVTYVLMLTNAALRSSYNKYLEGFFQAVAWLDMYIRMHCCYYNNQGVLVSHPIHTAQHYFQTSFAIDIYASFPYDYFYIHQMFGRVYETQTYMIMIVVTRTFLSYRIFGGLRYLHQDKTIEIKSIILRNVKYCLVLIVLLAALAEFLQVATCYYEEDNLSFSCPNDTWLGRSRFGQNLTKFSIDYVSIYFVLDIFATSNVGTFETLTYKEVIIYMFLVIILFSLRWFVLAKITSSGVSNT